MEQTPFAFFGDPAAGIHRIAEVFYDPFLRIVSEVRNLDRPPGGGEDGARANRADERN